MPLTPSRIAQRLISFELPFAGDVIKLTYRGAVADNLDGDQLLRDIKAQLAALPPEATEAERAAVQRRFVAEQFCAIVAAWDCCEDPAPGDPNGTPGPVIPLTVERILQFEDDGFLTAILAGIQRHSKASK